MNRFAEAEGLLRSALQLSPRDPLIMAHLARALAKQGKAQEASAFYRNALAVDEKCIEAQQGLTELQK
jgi:Flp pilus assembly protein TadD